MKLYEINRLSAEKALLKLGKWEMYNPETSALQGFLMSAFRRIDKLEARIKKLEERK